MNDKTMLGAYVAFIAGVFGWSASLAPTLGESGYMGIVGLVFLGIVYRRYRRGER